MSNKDNETVKTTTVQVYRMIRKIGSGASAEVWQATKDGQEFAIKFFKMDSSDSN